MKTLSEHATQREQTNEDCSEQQHKGSRLITVFWSHATQREQTNEDCTRVQLAKGADS